MSKQRARAMAPPRVYYLSVIPDREPTGLCETGRSLVNNRREAEPSRQR